MKPQKLKYWLINFWSEGQIVDFITVWARDKKHAIDMACADSHKRNIGADKLTVRVNMYRSKSEGLEGKKP